MRSGPIVQLVLNGVRGDARVVKTGRALADAGGEVVFVGDAGRWSGGLPGRLRQAEPIDGLPLLLASAIASDPFQVGLGHLTGAAGSVAAAAVSGVRSVARAVRPVSSLVWRAQRSAQARLRRRNLVAEIVALRPSVVHAHDLFAFWEVAPGLHAAGVPVIYDSHELESGLHRPTWSADRMRRHIQHERQTIHCASHIVTVAPSIADIIAERYGVPKPTVTLNAPPSTLIRENEPLSRRLQLPEGHKVVLYLGGLQAGRGLEELFAALPQLDPRVHVAFLGPVTQAFRPQFDKLMAGADGGRVHRLDRVPYADVIATAWGADLGYNAIALESESYRNALPNKFFEYVFANIPVISTPQTDVVRLTKAFDLGAIVAPDDVSGLVAAIERRLFVAPRPLDPTRRERFIHAHAWERQAETLVSLYRSAGYL